MPFEWILWLLYTPTAFNYLINNTSALNNIWIRVANYWCYLTCTLYRDCISPPLWGGSQNNGGDEKRVMGGKFSLPFGLPLGGKLSFIPPPFVGGKLNWRKSLPPHHGGEARSLRNCFPPTMGGKWGVTEITSPPPWGGSRTCVLTGETTCLGKPAALHVRLPSVGTPQTVRGNVRTRPKSHAAWAVVSLCGFWQPSPRSTSADHVCAVPRPGECCLPRSVLLQCTGVFGKFYLSMIV